MIVFEKIFKIVFLLLVVLFCALNLFEVISNSMLIITCSLMIFCLGIFSIFKYTHNKKFKDLKKAISYILLSSILFLNIKFVVVIIVLIIILNKDEISI